MQRCRPLAESGTRDSVMSTGSGGEDGLKEDFWKEKHSSFSFRPSSSLQSNTMAPKAAASSGAKAAGKVKKAQQAAKGLKCANSFKKARVRTNVHFFRPHTLRKSRQPKVARRSSDVATCTFPKLSKTDKYTIVRQPLTTESAMKKIEETNTLVFLVDPRSNKRQIKQAVKELYDVNAQRVNTLIRPDGLKKAYVRLTSDFDALDVANKIGII
ncbi:ribosomal protein RPL23A [Besnoitia besnoiti]|uniref:Ribosomal protein RPL23A n=1 Tax=Besnoitia besnoiti TaxID=94643 RepID=A0A2A9M9E0_BESBE|nr:ribosomal protein RPL23A [Besnoitia besnoiti]PFH32931.1 ribosomal protein RPL23A [Besnoitia besnoiti]